jgi:hypothetical protein
VYYHFKHDTTTTVAAIILYFDISWARPSLAGDLGLLQGSLFSGCFFAFYVGLEILYGVLNVSCFFLY